MRKINYIVLHCTATPQTAKVASLISYWKNVMKWSNPGYHYVIEASGQVHNIHQIEKVANGVAGHNADSIHISYIGGIDSIGNALDNRTNEQIDAQIKLIRLLKEKFPAAKILGHRDFPGVKKACPSFNVSSWLKSAGLNQ